MNVDKRITKLGTEPLYVGLADRDCSLFINPQTGDILLDEGDGEGRVNGAVFYADKEPRFHVIPAPEGGQLLLVYRRHLLTLGISDSLTALHDWADAANRFLATKRPARTELTANGHQPAAVSDPKPATEIESSEPETQHHGG